MKNLYAPKGIIPVPPTPFAKNDTINEAEYKRLLDYYSETIALREYGKPAVQNHLNGRFFILSTADQFI